ncbi:hypothetical protein WJX73_004940 [Symbiochloris irregularis]|uniref:Histone deacetylase domain-containing protein n=1 Tax=Symbiochloris irregularis TaxID=706552 RepID=A0AAW1P5Y4_9CHLO
MHKGDIFFRNWLARQRMQTLGWIQHLKKTLQVIPVRCTSLLPPQYHSARTVAKTAVTVANGVTESTARAAKVTSLGLRDQHCPSASMSTRAEPGKSGKGQQGRIIYTLEAARDHCWPDNQEGPRRLTCVKDVLPATSEEVQRVHDPAYVQWLAETVREGVPKVVADPEIPEEVTYVTSTSYDDALQAAGSAMRLVDEVAAASTSGSEGHQCPVGFAIVRPPGHHSGVDSASGFCLLNNVAIAARHAQHQHGLRKVLILDFDVHCGNGTVDIFAQDPDVLVIDMHETDVWPHTGRIDQTGEGKGRGATIDIPLPTGSGQWAAEHVFDSVIASAARRFKPDILLVSAGYDAHWRDPLAGLNFQSATYHLLAGKLQSLAQELCGGRLVFVLEGGYSSEGLASSVAETFLGLLGTPPAHALDSSVPEEPKAAVQQLIADLRELHAL